MSELGPPAEQRRLDLLGDRADLQLGQFRIAPRQVGADDALIKVQMTAINNWDLRYRAGKLPKLALPGRRLADALPAGEGRGGGDRRGR